MRKRHKDILLIVLILVWLVVLGYWFKVDYNPSKAELNNKILNQQEYLESQTEELNRLRIRFDIYDKIIQDYETQVEDLENLIIELKDRISYLEGLNIFEVVATAYTDDVASQGKWVGQTATGVKPQEGIIAVDPKVIPLHSEVYVEGFGILKAMDTGGAIKGNKIDIFMDSKEACRSFGRRRLKVRVLN